MDLRVLQFVEAIGRLGSFTRAAEEIHVAQPALSTSVKKLEDELGVPLFFRFPRGALPTPEGKLLLTRAARIFAEIDSLKREIADASELRTGNVTVGFPPMYGLHYFPKLIMAFRTRYPGVDISAVEGSATDIKDRLDAGTIDIGILETRRVDKAWKSVRLGSDEMVLAVAENHPLSSKKSVKASGLNNLPMVVLSEGFLQRALLDKYCGVHKVQYRKVMECNFVHMTILAAMEGHGAATLLRSLVNSQPGLVAISFEPKMSFNFELCWRRDRYFSKASQALVKFATTPDTSASADVG
jgi:LysR family transcriptional regulator, cyn operon transcriptional activator